MTGGREASGCPAERMFNPTKDLRMNPITNSLMICLWTALAGQTAALAQTPVMTWDFETVKNGSVIEENTHITDTVEGYFEWAEGVSGKGLRLDGFTTRVVRNGKDLKKLRINLFL